MPKSPLKPVSTRSALLTVLIGAEVPSLSARELVAIGSYLGFAEPTVRVALSRMSATGDLVRTDDGGYRLSDRLLDRQRRQERAVHPRTKAWRGEWEVAVVTATGRSASERAELRTVLTGLRVAELREGVWVRPANLRIEWPEWIDEQITRFTGRVDGVADDAALVTRLWDLHRWAATARALLRATDATEPRLRFTACATSGRHLLDDPVLPPELLPADWPGDELRASHLAYRQWIVDVRKSLTSP